MTTYSELLTPNKGEKHAAFIFTSSPDDFGPHIGTLTVSTTRSHTVYWVEEFPCDHGRGFMLFKRAGGTDHEETQYGCFLGSDGTGHCECKGFTRYAKCKHLASLHELVKAGIV